MTRLVVVYDAGSARTGEIMSGLGGLGDVTFAVPPSAAAPALLAAMRSLGDVVTLDRGIDDQVARTWCTSCITTRLRQCRAR
jgi:hypothetical protein